MPCHTRMKRILQGLLWLLLMEFGLTVMSLEPGFLDFDNLPDTNFSCVGKVIGGYYADLETNCQMFHVCTIGQLDEPMDIRFLCLNGTVFDQETRVCERIDEVDCSKSEQFYSLNLELYGNTQPPILEESPEIDFPVEVKRSSTTTTTTTTTTQRPSHPKSTSPPYYKTSSAPTTARGVTKVITSHHFPVVNSPDIRFNPEEINISLNPGAPPDISRSQVPISFQQQSHSEKNTRVTVTTHTTIYKNDKPHRVPLLPTPNPPSHILVEHDHLERPKAHQTTQTPKSIVSYGLTHNQHNQGSQVATPTEINYGFTYQQTEESVEYNTEVPPHPYQYHIANLRPPSAHGHPYHLNYHTTSKRPPHKVNFPAPTTYRNHPVFSSSAKSAIQQFHSQRTERPPRLQLPLPLLPTLPPLTFSSPAPFSLGRHIETKRYTNDHQSPPRIIISASASVSDNSGRRLNYSLGTIGATHFIGSSPASYDDYKEDDVGLDPFYHDVPKIKSTRHKREVSEDHTIKNDQEAADLLRFLFNWYKKREKLRKISIPVASDDITEINDELAPLAHIEASTSAEEDYETLFRKMIVENITEINTETTPAKEEHLDKDENTHKNNIGHIDKFIDSADYYLSPNLERTKKDKEFEVVVADKNNKTSKNLDDIQTIQNATLSNEVSLKEAHENIPSSTVKTNEKKKKRPRNQRRRNNKSGTTTRTKKPKASRRQNNPEAAFSNSQLQNNQSRNLTKSSRRFSSPRQKTDNSSNSLGIPNLPLHHLADIPLDDTILPKSDKQDNELIEITNKENKNETSDKELLTTYSSIPETSTSENVNLLPELVNADKKLTSLMENTDAQDKHGNNTSKLPVRLESIKELERSRSLPEADQNDHTHESELSGDRQFTNDEQVETHESKQREHIILIDENKQTLVTTVHGDFENYDVITDSSLQSQTEPFSETTTTTTETPTEYKINTTNLEESEQSITTLSFEFDNLLTTHTPVDYDITEKISNYESMGNSETTTLSNKENNKPFEKVIDHDLENTEEHGGETSSTTETSSTSSDLDVLEAEHYEDNTSDTAEHNEEHSIDDAENLLKNLEFVMTTLHMDLLNLGTYTTTPRAEEDSETAKNDIVTESINVVTENLEISSTTPSSEIRHVDNASESHLHKVNLESTEDGLELKTNTEKVDHHGESALNVDYEDENLEIKNRNINTPKTASRRIYDVTSEEEDFVVIPKLSSRLRSRNRSKDQKYDINNYVRNRKFTATSHQDTKNVEEPTLVKVKHNVAQKVPDNAESDSSTSKESITDTEVSPIPDYVDDNYEPLTYQKSSHLKDEYKIDNTATHLEEFTTIDELQQLNDVEFSTYHSDDIDLADLTTVVPDKISANKETDIENTNKNEFFEHSHKKDVDATIIAQETDEKTTTTFISDEIIPSTQSYQVDIIPPTTNYWEYSTTEAYPKLTEEPPTDSTLLTTQTMEITTLPTTTEAESDTHNFETTKEPTITTTLDDTEPSTVTPSLPEYHQTTSSSTESIHTTMDYRSYTTGQPAEETTLNLDTTQATSASPSSTTDSSASLTSLTEPDYELDLTTPLSESSTLNRYQHLKTRLPWYKRQDNIKRKETARHRFSTLNGRRKSSREKPKLPTIRKTDVLKHSFSSRNSSRTRTEQLLIGKNNNTAKLSDTETRISNNTNNIKSNKLELRQHIKQMQIEPPHPVIASAIKPGDSVATTVASTRGLEATTIVEQEIKISGDNKADIALTDAPLLKSANPTKAKYTKIVFTTTPLSKLVRVELRKDMYGRRYTFNCFDKKIHQFYSDPRDCRLFHYCTLGYTKNQMVDMKFVCDSGTYFDDEKLICTKVKPARCL